MTNIEKNILDLMLQNRKAEAVSLLFEDTQKLSEAKAIIDNVAQKLQYFQTQVGSLEVLKPLVAGNKIEAVKLVKNTRSGG
jgi:hypothetical protein